MKLIIVTFWFIAFCFPVQAKQVIVDGVAFTSFKLAKKSIKDGSKIFLSKGVYTQGVNLKASNIEILGEKGVVFDNASVNGKAALVLKGDNIFIENIECRNIQVKDGNGACIRFEGRNLTVRGLYAHDSHSGLMTSKDAGIVNIEYSRFERLGNRGGYSHAIYVKADLLSIKYSEFLSTKKQGSAVKTRSKKTVIEYSLLASIDGKDSRLVDAANYGELIIRNSILEQGVNTSNSQLLAYGLEKKVPVKTEVNKIEVTGNLLLLDRKKANVILKHRLADEVIVANNIIVGDPLDKKEFLKTNTWYKNRSSAKLQPYPYIPEVDDIERLKTYIQLVGDAEK
ncbi:hypothetical protein RI845_18255 [Thalassotalea nanhaiensis]|uniref:Right handed beta helix domain-containing protein n=1 Tax=Thalassotalea nanhaiensis TaxID=3065648 RepID=A0ABY9TI09_9GAMM|nr:hypothetical protein RI845_18255 [Colwelliaceae bacterium SQ345]